MTPAKKPKTEDVCMEYAMHPRCRHLRTLKSWCKKYPKSGKALTALFLDLRRQKADELRTAHQWGTLP